MHARAILIFPLIIGLLALSGCKAIYLSSTLPEKLDEENLAHYQVDEIVSEREISREILNRELKALSTDHLGKPLNLRVEISETPHDTPEEMAAKAIGNIFSTAAGHTDYEVSRSVITEVYNASNGDLIGTWKWDWSTLLRQTLYSPAALIDSGRYEGTQAKHIGFAKTESLEVDGHFFIQELAKSIILASRKE